MMPSTRSLLSLVLAASSLSSSVVAFVPSIDTPTRQTTQIPAQACRNEDDDAVNHRRQVLLRGIVAAAAVVTTGVPISHAVVMDNSNAVFKPGETLGVDAAKARFGQARQSLEYLIQNYDTIVQAGGGDNVRRYLGTVGTTSGLWGIEKVLKELQDEAEDIVEYTENKADFEYYLRAADTAVYSSIFVEYSSAKAKPADFFRDAKKDIDNMQLYMDKMAKDLQL